MELRLLLCASGLVLAGLAGCYTGPSVDISNGPTTTDSTTEQSPTDPASAAGSPATASTTGTGTTPQTVATATDLPCDVQQVLADHCTSCHGAKPSGGASNPLVTHDDLLKASRVNAKQTYAERSVLRMNDTSSPMPPASEKPMTTAEIAVFTDWVNAGAPTATCSSNANDGGTGQ
jgi:uncharacterized membrane protein